jgi:MinD superfamily P-loop ATPase
VLDRPVPPKVPRVNEERCQACARCAARTACRVKAILAIDAGEPPFIDGSLCYGCLICVPACPHEAVVV